MLNASAALKTLLEDTVKSPILILEIEGIGSFSSGVVSRSLVYGDLVNYGDAIYYGGTIEDTTILPYIDLKRSSAQISQQLNSDKGGFSSVTNFDVTLVDKNNYVSSLIKSGNLVDDILSCKAKLYLTFDGLAHPQNSVLFFSGIVSGAPIGAGFVKLNLSSPEKLKNLEIFPKVSTTLTSSFSNVATTMNVETTSDFMTPSSANGLRTYLILNDEIIEYTGKTSTTFTGCVRGQFGTVAASYSSDQNVESAYRLIGNLRDLCLRLMLSGKNEDYVTGYAIAGINIYNTNSVANAVFISDGNFKDTKGVVIGDQIVLQNCSIGSNDGTYTITDIGIEEEYSYFVLNGTLSTEGSSGDFNLKSQFSVLPKFAGLEMTPDQVDVQEFIDKFNTFSASFFDYDFFIKDAVKGSDFINEQILFPSGCYALPRKAKTSIGLTIPPLAQSNTKTVDWTNVTNASALVVERNINQNFYNAVIYKYDPDQIEDKYQRGKIRQSTDSTNRIKIGNKPLTIEANGVRSSTDFNAIFDIQGRRFLERYQYGAQAIEVDVQFGFGFDIEIGDSVIFKGDDLLIYDSASGTRDFTPRIFEVTNKTLKLSGAPIRLRLLDTAFSLNGRYGVVSPSSKIDTGSTTTKLRLKRSYGTTLGFATESNKWRPLVGQKIRVRSQDYTFDEETYLTAIDPNYENGVILSPALSTAPSENYILDIAKYGVGTDLTFNALSKVLYAFFDLQLTVTGGSSQTVFTVSAPDAAKIKVGYIVKIHDVDYTNQSVERNVTNVTGTTITVDDALGFTPSNGQKIELLGFPDGGKPYRIL
jgi:hypothetical protein